MSAEENSARIESGMTRNSAISFLARAHPNQPSGSGQSNQTNEEKVREDMNQADRLVPAGLKALCDTCTKLYPDQPNPLQVTTRLKYWLGGQDPLDYVSMYWNPGKPEEDIPPHWHYVSFGLSDLHGDGRVHPPADRVLLCSEAPPPSGYGLELTLRLASAPGAPPPTWPAQLLQALARYVFTTGNKLAAGDHVSWHAALDGARGGSRVRHLLVAPEPALPAVATPTGTVTFLQVVGCTGRELRMAQRRSGFEVLKMLSEDPKCGGKSLVTEVSRRRSCAGVRAPRPPRPPRPGPLPLAGVSARLAFTAESLADSPSLSPRVEQQIKDTLARGLHSMTERSTEVSGHMSTDSFEMSSMERALPEIPELMQGSWQNEESIEYLDGVHLLLNPEGASLLPLAIEGRVKFGRHFTWSAPASRRAVSLVPRGVAGALVSDARPYVVAGHWLQVLVPPALADELSTAVSGLHRLADTDSETDSEGEGEGEACGRGRGALRPAVPLEMHFAAHRLRISVVPDHHLI